jgi:hypothetical protein
LVCGVELGVPVIFLIFALNFVAKDVLVICGATSILFIASAVYIVATGKIAPSFGSYPESGKVHSIPARLSIAALYTFSGAAILIVLAGKVGSEALLRLLFDILFALAFFSLAIHAIFRPAIVLGWILQAHPQFAGDERALWIIRIIGVAFLGGAILFSVTLFRGQVPAL